MASSNAAFIVVTNGLKLVSARLFMISNIRVFFYGAYHRFLGWVLQGLVKTPIYFQKGVLITALLGKRWF